MASGVRKFFVINLDRRPEKMANFLCKFPLQVQVERVPAVDGLHLPFDKEPLKSLIRDGDTFNPFVIGCTLSHYGIFDSIGSDSSYGDSDVFVTFEDDVFYSEDFVERFEEVCEKISRGQLGDFDMLRVAGRFGPRFVPPADALGTSWSKENVIPAKSGGIFCYDHAREESVRGGHYHDRCTHCLVWTKRFAIKIVKYVNDRRMLEISEDVRGGRGYAIDVLIQRFILDGNCRILEMFPHICYSPADYMTDIQHTPSITVKATVKATDVSE